MLEGADYTHTKRWWWGCQQVQQLQIIKGEVLGLYRPDIPVHLTRFIYVTVLKLTCVM